MLNTSYTGATDHLTSTEWHFLFFTTLIKASIKEHPRNVYIYILKYDDDDDDEDETFS